MIKEIVPYSLKIGVKKFKIVDPNKHTDIVIFGPKYKTNNPPINCESEYPMKNEDKTLTKF